MTDKLDEARMSAAVKLQKAYEREQQKSAASRQRGQELLNQNKKKEEDSKIQQANEGTTQPSGTDRIEVAGNDVPAKQVKGKAVKSFKFFTTNESWTFDTAAMAKQELSDAKNKKHRKRGKVANLLRKLGMKEAAEHEVEQQLQEVLSKDAAAGEWIKDFIDSDNPKFAGKSKEKRKQMALAAYYAKQRNEEVEHIEERNQENATKRKMMDASRGAKFKLNNPVPEAGEEHKTTQAHNKAIGRALRKEAYQSHSGPSHGHAYGGTGFKRREREDDEYHNEPSTSSRKPSSDAPHAVHINGKKWKSFGSHSHASNVAKKIKGATVHKEETELEEANWIAGAIKKPGAETAAAARAGESTHEYMEKHKHDSGKAGKRARLGLTLSKLSKEETMPIKPKSLREFIETIQEAKPLNVDKVNTAGEAPHEEKWEAAKKPAVKKESFTAEELLVALKEGLWPGTPEHTAKFGDKYAQKQGGGAGVKKGYRYGGGAQKPDAEDDNDADDKPAKKPKNK